MRECLAELQAHDPIGVAFEGSDGTPSTPPVALYRKTFTIYVFPWPSDGLCG